MSLTMKEAAAGFADLIEVDPSFWTKFSYGANNRGSEVNVMSPSACSWCIVGGVMAGAGVSRETAQQFLLPAVRQLDPLSYAEGFNNSSNVNVNDIVKVLRIAAGEIKA